MPPFLTVLLLCLIAPVGLLMPRLARTQAAPPSVAAPMGLAAAVALARQSAPGLRLADAKREAASGRVREGQQFANPTVEYRRENLGSSLLPDVFATVYVPFDVTGRRLALRQAGARGQERVTADAQADRSEQELRVARAWLRAAVADGQLAIAESQAAALAEVATVDSLRARDGLVADGVALRTRLEADRARAAVALVDGERARARGDLSRALGLPDELLPELAPLAAPPLPEPPDSARVRAIAVAARPEIAAREAGFREAESRLNAERRGALGDWQLQGGSKETGGFMTGQLGVAVPFPIFHRNDGARQRARGELAEARALRDDARLGARAEAAASLRAYVVLRALAGSAQSFASRGREVSGIARTAYREGHATLTELLDAERAAADAMLSHVRWAADAWLARLELERALGARLDADGPLELPLLSSIRMTP